MPKTHLSRSRNVLALVVGGVCCLVSLALLAWNTDWVPMRGGLIVAPRATASLAEPSDQLKASGDSAGRSGAVGDDGYTDMYDDGLGGESPWLTQSWEEGDISGCPMPGTPMDGMPSSVQKSALVDSLRTGDLAAYQRAVAATNLGDQRWLWLGPYLAKHDCWAMLQLAYDHGLSFGADDVDANSSPLFVAYNRHNADAVGVALAGLYASEDHTEAQKKAIALTHWQAWGWSSMELVTVHAPYGLTPLSREPDHPRGWTVLHSAASRFEPEYLRSLLQHSTGQQLPADLLLTATSSAIDLEHGNSARAAERRAKAVATIELLREYGYDPAQTIDWIRVESGDGRAPAKVVSREHYSAQQYAITFGAPTQITDALS